MEVSAVGHDSGARKGGRKSNFGTAAQVRAHLKYATKSSCREGSEEIITQVGDYPRAVKNSDRDSLSSTPSGLREA